LADCLRLCKEAAGLVHVAPDAAELGAQLAWSISWGRPVSELPTGPVEEETRRLLDELPRRYSLEALRSDPIVRAYRDFYWRIGIDPTKTRPSSEALVRRALRGKWPRINPVVDAGNIASAKTLVPIGLYDVDRFKPPLVLRTSTGEEEFHPIGGGREKPPRGAPILVDAEGKVLHLFPHRDSRETMVTEATSCILVLAAGVPRVPRERLVEAVKETQRILAALGWENCPETHTAP
jgi:DNA/RNA-binding domain of Phe-tRNA-synthetase-like protein